LLSGSVSSDLLLSGGAAVSSDLLSGDAPALCDGLLQQLLLRIDLVAYTAYETSCDCIQDAGADPQALFTCVVYAKL